MDPQLLAQAQTLLAEKIAAHQNGVPTYFDNWLQRCIDYAGNDAATIAARDASINEFLRIARQPRLQHWNDRHAATRARGSLPTIALVRSQGVARIPQWKRLPLFKSAFDLVIYQQLLDDLKPRHILEIGSGSGASALWLHDMAAGLYGPAQVISLDIAPPDVNEPGVKFLRCDCREPDALAPALASITREGPVLVIEDAHEGVDRVLAQLHAWLRPGDYLIVEDSQTKQDVIAASPLAASRDFAVDTAYVDLFGTNATSCIDSIFVRLET